MLHETLWNENADLAQQCRDHPFVLGLEHGTLEPAAFQRYVAQDAYYLRAFMRAYALALAKVNEIEPARELHTLIGGVLEELRLHETYAKRLQIDLARVQPYPTTTAYVNFLLHTAWHSDAGHTLAAMTPCMRLYAHLGRALAPTLRDDHPYAEWIRTYSGDEFEGLARRIEHLLDRLAQDTLATHDAYHYAMYCEREFFGAPLGADT